MTQKTRPLKPSEIPQHVHDLFVREGFQWYYDLEVNGYYASKGSDLIGYTQKVRSYLAIQKLLVNIFFIVLKHAQ